MANLSFFYSAMNAGKSTALLQASYNYNERGMRTMKFIPAIDTRAGVGVIRSRIGLSADANAVRESDDLLETVRESHRLASISCILIDEAQFLTREQVIQCSAIADDLGIPVLCYGLRTDFKGELFSGSAALLGWADELVELRTICHCGREATMNLRVDANGNAVSEGAQIEIGGSERYVAVCRRHFKQALSAPGPA